MHKRILFSAISCILVLIALFAVLHFLPQPKVSWSIPQQAESDRILTIAADVDYQPYSFLDENGQPAGHDVELACALGQQLGAQVKLELVQWSDALAGLESGRYDMLMGTTYTPSRLSTMCFSTPVISEPYMAFSYSGKTFSLSDLYDARLCTISGDSITDSFLTPYSLCDNTQYQATYTACFSRLVQGECDYVIAPYTTGCQLIRSMGLDGVEPVSDALYISTYCVAVPSSKSGLADEINAALSVLSQNGRLAEIYERWMVRYTNAASFDAFFAENQDYFYIGGLCILLIFFILFYFVQRSSYKKLSIAIQRSRIFEETVTDPLMEYIPLQDVLIYTYKDAQGVSHQVRCEHYFAHNLYRDKIDPNFIQEYTRLLKGDFSAKDGAVLEYRAQVANRQWGWYRLTLHGVTDVAGKIIRVLARLEDITRDVQRANDALQLAYTDTLTGLMTREAFLGAVTARLCAQPDRYYGFVLMDIDDFKAVNDSYGHMAGDKAIQALADCLRETFLPDGLLGRFGGDEFLIFMQFSQEDCVQQAVECIDRFAQRLRLVHVAEGLTLTSSFGLGYTNDAGLSAEKLLQMADQRMYAAKQSGKNKICRSMSAENQTL